MLHLQQILDRSEMGMEYNEKILYPQRSIFMNLQFSARSINQNHPSSSADLQYPWRRVRLWPDRLDVRTLLSLRRASGGKISGRIPCKHLVCTDALGLRQHSGGNLRRSVEQPVFIGRCINVICSFHKISSTWLLWQNSPTFISSLRIKILSQGWSSSLVSSLPAKIFSGQS